jgi:hypothetical protein
MTRTRTKARTTALTAVAAALASCTNANPSYCDANVPCGDPSRPFCDAAGVYRASGGFTNTCIPEPGCYGGICGIDAPVCEIEIERCVRCREDEDCARFGETKVCAPDGTCVGCEVDGDCESDACHPVTRQCAAEEEVIYVDRTHGTAGSECTRVAPCSDLRLAIGQMSSDRFIMRIAPGGYPSGITIPAGDLVILADANAILTPGTASEMLRIETGADVLLRGVSLRGPAGPDGMRAIACEGGAGEPATHLQLMNVLVSGAPGDGVQLDHCQADILATTIEDNGGVGLTSVSGRLVVARSRVSQNLGGALLASGTAISFRNNFIRANGSPPVKGSPDGLGAGLLADPADGSRFEHNTLASNHGTLQCLNAFTISNNILFDNTAGEEGIGCRHRFSLVRSAVPGGPGNVRGIPNFVDTDAGDDLHLEAPSPGIDQGEGTGVSDDIDGQPRPAGAASDIGADEVGPG